MPRWMIPTLVVLAAASIVPAALIARARATHQATPRINIIPDMDYQPKYLPQTANAMFADGRAAREFPKGTVARGALLEDEHLQRGLVGGDWATSFPMTVTDSLMSRGRQRFEIYCAPCHGLDGAGQGLVARRADQLMQMGAAQWTPPLSVHDDVVRQRPVGHLFNTISYGIRTMPAYGPQISVADRWAIVAYVRALQRSSRASVADVPAEDRSLLAGG
ncbi:MAG: c-type cytochrome [Candidatus Eiseniibacteriota bacterium]